jgi:hypothetical protein
VLRKRRFLTAFGMTAQCNHCTWVLRKRRFLTAFGMTAQCNHCTWVVGKRRFLAALGMTTAVQPPHLGAEEKEIGFAELRFAPVPRCARNDDRNSKFIIHNSKFIILNS